MSTCWFYLKKTEAHHCWDEINQSWFGLVRLKYFTDEHRVAKKWLPCLCNIDCPYMHLFHMYRILHDRTDKRQVQRLCYKYTCKCAVPFAIWNHSNAQNSIRQWTRRVRLAMALAQWAKAWPLWIEVANRKMAISKNPTMCHCLGAGHGGEGPRWDWI